MKILAANKQPNGRTIYIAQLDADELRAITVLHPYGKIPVTEESGAVGERDADDLKPGSVIDPECSRERVQTIASAIEAREEIEKAFASLRGSFTRVLNAFPPKK